MSGHTITIADATTAPGPGPRAPRMLTGDRPTGRLHLGHYVGSLANRIRLHRRYESFFIVADLHMLTTKNSAADIAAVPGNATEMVLDSLAAGPAYSKSAYFIGLPSPVGHAAALVSAAPSVLRRGPRDIDTRHNIHWHTRQRVTYPGGMQRHGNQAWWPS